MNDPYSVLGVSRTASDEDIKKAYRELARKYHPDNYVNNPLADLAQEKMKEINEAYEQINRERTGGAATQSQYSSYGNTGSYSNTAASGYNSSAYAEARAAINNGQLDRAEMILGSMTERGAEWSFLMGSLYYRRGWMDNALNYFRQAVSLDPGNPEYRQAYNYMVNNAKQPYTPSTGNRVQNVDPCSICGNLLVADCCCEMMGGDLIRCC